MEQGNNQEIMESVPSPDSGLSRRESLEKGETLPILGRLLEEIPEEFKEIEVRPAQNFEDLKKAYHLVYKEYLKMNAINPNKLEMHLSLYLALPNTSTVVAVYKKTGDVIGTLSLVEDSPVGLPMELIYSKELERLRGQGRHPAEATMLAIDGEATSSTGIYPLAPGKKLLLLFHLFRKGFDFLRTCRQVEDIVACFHPKHEILYKFIQMKPFGGLKSYSRVNGKPTVARHLDVVEALSRASEVPVLNFFFGHPPLPRVCYARRFEYSFEEFRELFADESEILFTAEPYQLEFIKSAYTNFDWDQIFFKDPSKFLFPWLQKCMQIILPDPE